MLKSKDSESFLDTPEVDSFAERRPRKELDLIDLIAFLWGSRLELILALGLGAISGFFGWIWLNTVNRNQPFQHKFWTASIHDVFPKFTAEEASQKLSNFLKTQQGAKSLYQGINSVAQFEPLPTEVWIQKQVLGEGIVEGVRVGKGDVIVTLRIPDKWSKSELDLRVMYGLNSAIREFNSTEQKEFDELFQEEFSVKSRLSRLKLKVIQLYDRHSTLTANAKAAVISNVVDSLPQSLTADSVIFLLSDVPDHVVDKKALIRDFGEYRRKIELLQRRMKNEGYDLLTATGYLPLVELNSPLKSAAIARTIANNSLSELKGNLPFFLIVGAIAGFVLGILVWLSKSYWKKNSGRIRMIFKTKEVI
jgi:hypothetical protein